MQQKYFVIVYNRNMKHENIHNLNIPKIGFGTWKNDQKKFFEISSNASGQCWSMTSYCPVPGVGPTTPADNGYQGGFATALMLKDLKLAMEAAQSAGVDPQMGRRAKELYEAYDAAGNGGADFSGIIRTL